MANTDYSGTDNLEVMREAVNYNAFLLDLVRRHAPRRGRLLDFGAGLGTFAAPLQREGMDVTCVEPDPRLGSTLRNQGLAVANAIEQVPDQSFDYIYSLNVLEHIDDDAAALAALYCKLKPGGRLLIYVPAFQALFSSMDRKVGHRRRYRRLDLAAQTSSAGFSVEAVRYIDSLGFVASLAFRVFDNGTGDLSPAKIRIYDRFLFPASLALDHVLWPFLGKNLLVLARR